MTGIEPLDHDLYDEATLARLDRPRIVTRRRVSSVRRRSAAGIIVAAMLTGVADALDPPRRVEIEMVDPWTGGGGSSRVLLHWHPVPSQTVAEVRDA